MSGIKFLLDTNIIIGLLKNNPQAINLANKTNLELRVSGVSVITRIELLGYKAIEAAEEKSIFEMLSLCHSLPINTKIEDWAIKLRKETSLKLPDVLILSTALAHDLKLLTLDKELEAAFINRRNDTARKRNY